MNRENIYSLKGFSKVYAFTLGQTFKNKAYLASIFIFMLVFIFMGPLNYFMTKSSMGAAESALSKDIDDIQLGDIYIKNNTAIGMNKLELGNAEVHIYNTDSAEKIEEDKLKDELKENDAIIIIDKEATNYNLPLSST